MKSFLMGSHAYGEPKVGSDIDLVVFVTKEESDILRSKADVAYPCRYGKLNLVICYTQERYDKWKAVTDWLIAQKPVTREEAIEAYTKAGLTNQKDGELISAD